MDILNLEPSAASLCLSFLTVVLFCVCSLQFLREITKPMPIVNRTGYARAALRVGQVYRSTAWGILTSFFLVSLVMSFVDVFTRL